MTGSLVWIDLEMTGLDPEQHVIVEIATIITDPDLHVIEEGPHIVVHHSEDVLDRMDDWSRNHHRDSGLLDKVRASNDDCAQAEERTLSFISKYCQKGESPLCGNSVWQDRRFLTKYMPQLESFLHYRIIDVSTVKELVKRWYPDLPRFKKQKLHLALDDIHESIGEWRYYRETVFKN
ncbi:MAG: oligoribonuclease [Thermodesulfobacteriota bacterium]